MKNIRSQKGEISFSLIVLLLFVGIGIYVGVMFATPWIRFQQVEELFKEQVVRLKVASEEEVLSGIKLKLGQLNVPLKIEDVKIIKEEGKQPVIQAEYKVVLKFIGGYQHVLIYKPRAEAPAGAGFS